MKEATVSVVMATYNGEKFIRQQIESILSQTYPVFEIIIQDDGSTDRTVEIAEEYAAKHSCIRVVRNEKNQGWNLNFISAFRLAKGEYLAISDQDDIWYPQKLKREIETIGEKDMCFSFRYKDPEYTEHGELLGHPQNDFECLLFTSVIPGHSMLCRTAFVRDIEEWNKDIPYDWWIAIQAYLHRGAARVEEALNWHRPHVDSASALLMREQWEKAKRTTWQPYVFGWTAFRRYQKREDWRWLYTYIANHTSPDNHPTANKIAKLMLSPKWADTLRLCLTIMNNRQRVHARFAGGKGLAFVLGAVRAFFYPCMLAYNKNMSFLGKY